MPWSKNTIIFDLDGTLIDTAPDLHAALTHAFESKGLTAIDLPTVRSSIGHGARAMIETSANVTGISLTDTLLDELHKTFLDYYTSHIADHSAPFPGILDSLDVCEVRGATLAVCTNKTQHLAEQVLESLGLIDRFRAIVGADRTSEKKPSATHLLETLSLVGGQLDQAVMIGDSSTDGFAAQAAGMPFIFMTYGYPDDKTSELKPFKSLGSAEDLPAAIHECFS